MEILFTRQNLEKAATVVPVVVRQAELLAAATVQTVLTTAVYTLVALDKEQRHANLENTTAHFMLVAVEVLTVQVHRLAELAVLVAAVLYPQGQKTPAVEVAEVGLLVVQASPSSASINHKEAA